MSGRDLKPDDETEAQHDAQTEPSESDAGAHTEVRRNAPRPRSKVLPPGSGDEPDEDDPFNDVPV
jgi:hypothetical protein